MTYIIANVLVQWYILEVVIILFLATEGELCAFVELVGIAFSRDIHHQEVFTHVVEFIICDCVHCMIIDIQLLLLVNERIILISFLIIRV